MVGKRLPLLTSMSMVFISLALLVYSFFAPSSAYVATDTGYGHMFYPRIILSVWLFSAVILTYQYSTSRSVDIPPISSKKLFFSMALVLITCILLPLIGFVPACILFCFTYPFLLGYKNIRILIPVSVLYALAIWYIFNKVLLIILPESPWL